MSDLIVPKPVDLLKFRKRVKTVTLPDGRRAKVTREDGRLVYHIEHAEGIDAIVTPETIRLEVRPK